MKWKFLIYICFTLMSLNIAKAGEKESIYWKGSRFLYTDSNEFRALKVDLNEKGEAQVVSRHGVGSGSFTFEENSNSIHVTLTDRIFQAIQLTTVPPGETSERSVQVWKYFDKFLIEGSPNGAFITEFWTQCFDYDEDGKAEEGCEPGHFFKWGLEFLIKEDLKPLPKIFSEGDRVYFPLYGDTMGEFVRIEPNGEVFHIEKEIPPFTDKVFRRNNKVILDLRFAEITYGWTGKQMAPGVYQVIGTRKYSNGRESELVYGVIAVDQSVDLSNFEPSGTYKIIQSNGSLVPFDTKYIFQENGWGGIWTSAHPEEKSSMEVWKWSFKEDQRLHTWRYKKVDGEIVEDLPQALLCESEKKTNCFVFEKRSYIIIGKDGDKYTVLRKRQTRPSEKHSDVELHGAYLSLWIIEKETEGNSQP